MRFILSLKVPLQLLVFLSYINEDSLFILWNQKIAVKKLRSFFSPATWKKYHVFICVGYKTIQRDEWRE